VCTSLIAAKVADDKAIAGLTDPKNTDDKAVAGLAKVAEAVSNEADDTLLDVNNTNDEAVDVLYIAVVATMAVDNKAVAALVDAKTVCDSRRPLLASRRL
jgi:hypothetical protein